MPVRLALANCILACIWTDLNPLSSSAATLDVAFGILAPAMPPYDDKLPTAQARCVISRLDGALHSWKPWSKIKLRDHDEDMLVEPL